MAIETTFQEVQNHLLRQLDTELYWRKHWASELTRINGWLDGHDMLREDPEYIGLQQRCDEKVREWGIRSLATERQLLRNELDQRFTEAVVVG